MEDVNSTPQNENVNPREITQDDIKEQIAYMLTAETDSEKVELFVDILTCISPKHVYNVLISIINETTISIPANIIEMAVKKPERLQEIILITLGLFAEEEDRSTDIANLLAYVNIQIESIEKEYYLACNLLSEIIFSKVKEFPNVLKRLCVFSNEYKTPWLFTTINGNIDIIESVKRGCGEMKSDLKDLTPKIIHDGIIEIIERCRRKHFAAIKKRMGELSDILYDYKYYGNDKLKQAHAISNLFKKISPEILPDLMGYLLTVYGRGENILATDVDDYDAFGVDPRIVKIFKDVKFETILNYISEHNLSVDEASKFLADEFLKSPNVEEGISLICCIMNSELTPYEYIAHSSRSIVNEKFEYDYVLKKSARNAKRPSLALGELIDSISRGDKKFFNSSSAAGELLHLLDSINDTTEKQFFLSRIIDKSLFNGDKAREKSLNSSGAERSRDTNELPPDIQDILDKDPHAHAINFQDLMKIVRSNPSNPGAEILKKSRRG